MLLVLDATICVIQHNDLLMMPLGRLVVVKPHGSHDIVRRSVCVLALMPPKLVQLIAIISCWFCFCKMLKDVLIMLLLDTCFVKRYEEECNVIVRIVVPLLCKAFWKS